jgi:polyhydroxyalkanoate synthesis regulator phasin
MATVIGSLIVEMSANVARLQTDMNSAKDHVKTATEEITRAAEMAKGALAALGIGLGLNEFKEFITQSIEATARLNELSVRSGVSIQDLNGLQYAATQTGANFEDMTKGIKKLSLYLTEASINGGKHADMLATLGITAKDPMQAMYQLADAMQRIPDAAERTYVAQQLLGKGGEAMVPALLEGSDAFKALVDRGNELNPITVEYAKNCNELADKMEALAFAAKGNATIFAQQLVPVLTQISDEFLKAGNKADGFTLAGQGIAEVIKTLVVLGANVAYTFEQVGKGIGGTVAQLTLLAQGDFKGFSKLQDMMVAEGEAARIEIDRFSQAILESAPKQAEALKKPQGEIIKIAEETNTLNKSMQTLEQRIQTQTDLYKLSADAANKVSATEKLRIDVQNMVIAGTLTLSTTEQAHINVMLKKMAAAEKLAGQHADERAAQTEAQKIIEKANSSAAESIQQIEFERALLGKTTEERTRLTAARNIDLAVQKQIVALNANSVLAKEPAWLASSTAALKAEAAAALLAKNASLDLQKALAGQKLDKVGTENEQYKARLDALKAYHVAAQTDDADYKVQVQNAELEHQNTLTQLAQSGQMSRNQFEKMSTMSQISTISGLLQNATSQAAQHNKIAFEINKQASAANAIISTLAGATKALELGPIVGPIMAGVIYAAGMINVAAIESSTFGGSNASGSAPSAGGISSTSIPGQVANPHVVPSTVTATTAPAVNAPAMQPVNVYIQGNVMTADFVTNTVIPEIKNQITNADVTIIDPRSRQAQMLAGA